MALLIYFFQYPSYHVHVEGSECTLEEKGPKKVSSLAIGEKPNEASRQENFLDVDNFSTS